MVSKAESNTEACPRCSGRGSVICPQCKGTGELRNVSWVVIGPCTTCGQELKGFVPCPKCQGIIGAPCFAGRAQLAKGR